MNFILSTGNLRLAYSEDFVMCMLIKRLDSSKTLRWSLPTKKRCYCNGVGMRISEISNCPEDNYPNPKDLWFTDDPKILTQRSSWTPEKLDVLLDRMEDCAPSKFITVIMVIKTIDPCIHNTFSKRLSQRISFDRFVSKRFPEKYLNISFKIVYYFAVWSFMVTPV